MMSFRAREETLGRGNNGVVGLSIGTPETDGVKSGPLGSQEPVRRDTEGGVVMPERDGHVAVVLLPEVAAILAGKPDSVDPLLGDPRVVDRPGHHAAMRSIWSRASR